MKGCLRAILRLALLSSLLAWSAPAFADTIVRVRRDHTSVWTADFRTKLTVSAGTTLQVIGERNDWYEVVLPGHFRGETGFVHKSSVDPDDGTAMPLAKPPAGSAAPHADRSRLLGFFGFGEFGYARFAAQKSFQAVTGQGGDGLLGGGAEVRIGDDWFVNVSVNRMTPKGQRVYVAGDEVFKMGTPVAITLTPMTMTAGWRFAHERATPYFGGGVGRIHYHEHASFTGDEEDVDARFSSYHVLGGVEFRNEWVGTAFEVQYSRVPNALGLGGASAAFHESDLGGVTARIRILVGR